MNEMNLYVKNFEQSVQVINLHENLVKNHPAGVAEGIA